jgi:protein O-mannosyl-transferase
LYAENSQLQIVPQLKAQNPPASLSARSEWLPLVGVLVATLVTYASTFAFGWVYDDPPQIPQNQDLEWSRIGFLFTHQLWASTAGTEARFYRPLLTLWFLINKTVFGLNPHWFHVTTVLAHLAASALAFFVARALLEDAGSAFFAAAIFALHPLQVESASWISSVNDSLAAALCFASFLTYRRARTKQQNSAGWWILSGFLFLLALFTKEVSVVLPGIILVDLFNRSGDVRSTSSGRPLLTAISPYVAIVVLWLALRSWALGESAGTSSAASWSSCLLTAPKIFLFNLGRVFIPIGLASQYDFRAVESPGSVQFLLLVIAVLALVWLGVRVAKRDPRLWVAFAWLILPMVPTFNLRWMNQDDFVHDRYMYMSMLGVALFAGSAYGWIRNKWPNLQVVRPLAACIAVSLAFASAIQSEYWANDLILFSRAVSRAPDNEWAQLNYGSALSARSKFVEAAPHFVRSYELNPGWRAADFAGFAFQQSGDLPRGEQWFEAALHYNPSLANAWFGLGQIRLQQHLPEEAIPYLKKALEFGPTADGFHYELGTALEQVSQKSNAIEEYKTELQLHPYQTGAQKALDRLQATHSPVK